MGSGCPVAELWGVGSVYREVGRAGGRGGTVSFAETIEGLIMYARGYLVISLPQPPGLSEAKS